MARFNLDELSALLFKGTRENSVNDSSNQSIIIYGTALSDSADGFVPVQIDDAVYAADDLEDEEYEILSLSDDDDILGIDEQEELIDAEDYDEDNEDVVFWQEDDDFNEQQDE